MTEVDERRERDGALMRAVGEGDRRAFERLYALHRERVYRLAYGIVLDAHEARDVVQEVMVRLHDAGARWRPDATVLAWLHRVTVREALRTRRRLAGFARGWAFFGAHRTPEGDAAKSEALGAVERSLAKLDARERSLLALSFEAELPPAEIAEIVGLSANAARVALHRAREKLRRDLAAAGFEDPLLADPPPTFDPTEDS